MNPYEQVDARDEPRSYTNKPRWQRALVLLAGSGTHWILAFVTLLIAAMVLGFPNGQATNQVALVQQTLEGRPTAASNLGIHPGDSILAIAGRPVSHWSQIRGYIRLHPGDNVTFSIVHDGVRRNVPVQLGEAIVKGRDRIVAYAPAGQAIRKPRRGRAADRLPGGAAQARVQEVLADRRGGTRSRSDMGLHEVLGATGRRAVPHDLLGRAVVGAERARREGGRDRAR